MPSLYVIAGHGAGDPGAHGGGYDEAERVRALASRIAERGGASVTVLDTSRNWFADGGINGLSLPQDAQIVELHMDSGPAGAKGGHVIIKPGTSPDGYDQALAAFVTGMFPGRAEAIRTQALANATRAYNRGYGYRLVELGFISNPADLGTYNSHIDRMADGIMAAFGIVPGTPEKGDDLKPIHNKGGKVYRLYNRNDGQHHWVTDAGEAAALVATGWTDEGAGFTMPRGGTIAVFRLYNGASGEHMYTTSLTEARALQDAGWEYEQVPFFGNESGTPVYRLSNPNAPQHHWTPSTAERDSLVASGWRDEGIAWYAE